MGWIGGGRILRLRCRFVFIIHPAFGLVLMQTNNNIDGAKLALRQLHNEA